MTPNPNDAAALACLRKLWPNSPGSTQDAVAALSAANLIADPRDKAAREACVALARSEAILFQQAPLVARCIHAGAAYSSPPDPRAADIEAAEREVIAKADALVATWLPRPSNLLYSEPEKLRDAVDRLRALRRLAPRSVEAIAADVANGLKPAPGDGVIIERVPTRLLDELRAALARAKGGAK